MSDLQYDQHRRNFLHPTAGEQHLIDESLPMV